MYTVSSKWFFYMVTVCTIIVTGVTLDRLEDEQFTIKPGALSALLT